VDEIDYSYENLAGKVPIYEGKNRNESNPNL
jgi:hypothetical protein